MQEMRKDYILDRWVIISENRAARPRQVKRTLPQKVSLCFFCPGNEKTTPPEIGRVEEKGAWRIRWFPNKFPALTQKGSPETRKKGRFFSGADAYGFHEVLVETPDHSLEMDDLSAGQVADVLRVYALRIKTLSGKKGIRYVSVFKNQGAEAGTSLVHTHTQIIALPMVPPAVMEEVNAASKFRRCPYCEIARIEGKSQRKIFSSRNFISFAPFASRFSYEAWIFSRKHIRGLNELGESEFKELGEMLRKILGKLRRIGAHFNYFLHYAPKGKDLHFHIEITPRMAKWAGFEYATGIAINSVSPESAAKYYRGR